MDYTNALDENPQPRFHPSPTTGAAGLTQFNEIVQQLMGMKMRQRPAQPPSGLLGQPPPDPVMGTGYSGQVSPTAQAQSLSYLNPNGR
jgi:hypothetical protein